MGAVLNRASRAAALRRLAETRYDVIVVGGGVTGAGVALDAASRGLRTALVEQLDLAAGTSRWSSKLVHGGLRYLAKGDLGIAWESAAERHALITTIAPHLVRPMPTVLPLNDGTGAVMGLVSEAGIRLADALRLASGTSGRLLPRPMRVSARDALVYAPGLQDSGLRGAVVFWDGQLEDDARLVTEIARTAAGLGADVVTRCAATCLSDTSVILTDLLSGETLTARGHVVNATGVWAGAHAPSLDLAVSRGSHLVLRAEALGHPRAMISAPVPGRFGRFVFAVPHPDGVVHLGLTDEPVEGAVDPTCPAVPEADERFLLETISAALRHPVTSADVVGRFAGLRPLVRVAGKESADLSRAHLLLEEPDHPVTIVGGKLTTYRQMAQDAVDAVCQRIGEPRPCRTRRLPLLGAASAAELATVAAAPRLVRRYGTEAVAVQRLVDTLGEAEPWVAQPVSPGCPTIGAELLHAVLHEGALDVGDLLERRTRVSLVADDVDAARAVAALALEAGQASVSGRRGRLSPR